MKQVTKYFEEKPSYFKYSMFLMLGYCITFFSGAKNPQITREDIESAKIISYKQGKADALSIQRMRLGDTLIKNREKTLPAILAAPHKIDSLEHELAAAKAQAAAWREAALTIK